MSTTEEMLAEVKASKPAKLAQDKHSVQHLRHVARRAMYLPDLYVLRGDRGYTEAEQLERLDKADAEVTEAASQITKQLELALEAIALAKKVVKARARLSREVRCPGHRSPSSRIHREPSPAGGRLRHPAGGEREHGPQVHHRVGGQRVCPWRVRQGRRSDRQALERLAGQQVHRW
jgi:hypothetical protein